jgi:hypothetical protein
MLELGMVIEPDEYVDRAAPPPAGAITRFAATDVAGGLLLLSV